MDIKKIMIRQILPTFNMMDEIIQYLDEEDFHKHAKGYNIGRLIYHTIYWMGHYLVLEGLPLSFHKKDMQDLNQKGVPSPSKKILGEYLQVVKEKVVDNINKADVLEKIEDKTFLDLLMGQIRHSCFHVGWLQSYIYDKEGVWLSYEQPDYDR